LIPLWFVHRVAGLNKTGALIVSTSAVSDWRMNENIDAYYAQTSADVGNWNIYGNINWNSISWHTCN